MTKRRESEFWFAWTVGVDGEVVPFSVVPVDAATRSQVLKRVRAKMRRDSCDGGVAALVLELEVGEFNAQVWCDAAPGVPAAVGQAFFRTMVRKLPSLMLSA